MSEQLEKAMKPLQDTSKDIELTLNMIAKEREAREKHSENMQALEERTTRQKMRDDECGSLLKR